jgi:hypothetical protein
MSSDTYDSLTDSEQVIWQNEVKTGFLRKRVVEVQKILLILAFLPKRHFNSTLRARLYIIITNRLRCLPSHVCSSLLQNGIADLFSSYLYHADQVSL